MSEHNSDPTILAEIHTPIDATLEQEAAGWVLVMRRRFGHTPERLWRMIADPDQLIRWSPVVPNRPLTSVGPAKCHELPDQEWIDAEVLLTDAPHELIHRWGDDLLHWTITASESGSILELRHTFTDRSGASLFAAGWQVCLGTLATTDEDRDSERVVGERALAYGWRELADRYAMNWDRDQP